MRRLLCIVFAFGLAASPASGESRDMTCPINEHWVRPYHRRAYFRGDGTHVSAADVTGHCAKNQASYGTWKNKLSDGRPKNWHPKIEKSQRWTPEEKERVLEALDFLPEKLP